MFIGEPLNLFDAHRHIGGPDVDCRQRSQYTTYACAAILDKKTRFNLPFSFKAHKSCQAGSKLSRLKDFRFFSQLFVSQHLACAG